MCRTHRIPWCATVGEATYVFQNLGEKEAREEAAGQDQEGQEGREAGNRRGEASEDNRRPAPPERFFGVALTFPRHRKHGHTDPLAGVLSHIHTLSIREVSTRGWCVVPTQRFPAGSKCLCVLFLYRKFCFQSENQCSQCRSSPMFLKTL